MKILSVLDYYGLIPPNVRVNQNTNIMIQCPFHDEVEASCNINLKEGVYYCFGCGAKGDLIDFVSKVENTNRLLATQKITQIENKFGDGEEIDFDEIQVDHDKLLKNAEKFFNRLSMPDWNMMSEHYMLNRGFEPKILKEFNVKINHHSTHEIVIPLYENGKFKGYVSRRTDNDEPKYLYNRGFKRKDTLVGNLMKDHILVVEGIMDWMKAKQYGIKNVCALLGWKASDYHIKVIKEYLDGKIISALDNDEPGERGSRLLKRKFGNKYERFNFRDNVHDIGEIEREEFRKEILKKF